MLVVHAKRGSLALWPVVGAVMVLLAGCFPPPRTAASLPPQSDLERAVADAGLAAWRAAGLETTPTRCRLAELRIEPLTEAYEGACPDAWACLGWRGAQVPVAYISPSLPAALVAYQALHELLHAAGYCWGRWPDHDGPHVDQAVWAGEGGSRPGSVEQRAQMALDGPDIGAPGGAGPAAE